MKSRITYEKTCEVCHTKFISHSALAMYCPSCKLKVLRQQSRESQKRVQAREAVKEEIKETRKVQNSERLRQAVIEAEKRNMSYGRYVALMEGRLNDISGV